MINLLEGWDGSLDKENIAASVYSYTFFFLNKSLFQAYELNEEKNRYAYLDNYLMIDAMVRLIESAAKEGKDSHFNAICAKGYPDYTGANTCAYNIATSFSVAKRFLEENVSKRSEDWKWGNLLVKDWKNLPWSMTPLKPIFHRQTPAIGNVNTPNVARHTISKNLDTVVFHSTLAATYKQIIQLDSDPANDIGLYSIDTGFNENPF